MKNLKNVPRKYMNNICVKCKINTTQTAGYNKCRSNWPVIIIRICQMHQKALSKVWHRVIEYNSPAHSGFIDHDITGCFNHSSHYIFIFTAKVPIQMFRSNCNVFFGTEDNFILATSLHASLIFYFYFLCKSLPSGWTLHWSLAPSYFCWIYGSKKKNTFSQIG